MNEPETPPFAPPYHIVAFTNQRSDVIDGYGDMAVRMVELAREQPGFLGVDSVRDASGFGITNSYWRDEAAIVAWKANVEHLAAQEAGRSRWYQHFMVRVGRIERAYGFTAPRS